MNAHSPAVDDDLRRLVDVQAVDGPRGAERLPGGELGVAEFLVVLD